NTKDADTVAMAQVDLVAVKRKDVFFGKSPLERESQHGFRVLAAQGAFGRQVGVLNQLLRDGRSALTHALIARVAQDRPRDSDEVHPRMLKEAPVFDGENRAHENRGNIVITQGRPFSRL